MLLPILVVLALLLGIDIITIRGMVMRRLGVTWWVVLGVLGVVGAIGGVWGTMGEYRPTGRLRVFGFPFPVGVFVLEGDDWVDYVSPIGPLIVVLNFATFVVVSILPLSIAYAIRRLRRGPGVEG